MYRHGTFPLLCIPLNVLPPSLTCSHSCVFLQILNCPHLNDSPMSYSECGGSLWGRRNAEMLMCTQKCRDKKKYIYILISAHARCSTNVRHCKLMSKNSADSVMRIGKKLHCPNCTATLHLNLICWSFFFFQVNEWSCCMMVALGLRYWP